VRTATDAFARIVAASHTIATRVDVLFDREVIAEGVAGVEGTISFDRSAARLASLSCTIADPLRMPATPTDHLSPFGYELRVWRGVESLTGVGDSVVRRSDEAIVSRTDGSPVERVGPSVTGTEMLPLGTFPIQQSSIGAFTRVTSITATDRSQLVSDARFEDNYQIAAGTNYVTAIQALIEDGVPGLEFLFPTTTFVTPLLTFAAQDDRWAAAQRMTQAIGNEIYLDGLGRCAMRSEPTFDTEPVFTVADASNMIDVSMALDRAQAYNRVIAFSVNAATGDQFRGVATDDDPTSPTFYDGPFGRKPRFYASEFIASNTQAASAAAAILASELGVAKMVNFVVLPDPRLECADVVRITNASLGIDSLHIIDNLTMTIGPESAMSGGSRSQEGVVS